MCVVKVTKHKSAMFKLKKKNNILIKNTLRIDLVKFNGTEYTREDSFGPKLGTNKVRFGI